jgi:hypothetical protein
MREADLMRSIMIAASREGHRLFRNNVGAVKAADGPWIHYGVGGKGGSDLIGMTRQGRFAAIEVKASGKPTVEQTEFIEMVRRQGGVAGVAYNIEEALEILNGTG